MLTTNLQWHTPKKNFLIERASKEVNRHINHICFDRRTKDDLSKHFQLLSELLIRIIQRGPKIKPSDMFFGQAIDLDRGIFTAMPNDFTYLKGSLSSHIVKMLKTQSAMIELHKQRIQKGDKEHTKLPSTPDYTVFENGLLVLLNPASGTEKNRLQLRYTGLFLVLDHVDNTYRLQSKKGL